MSRSEVYLGGLGLVAFAALAAVPAGLSGFWISLAVTLLSNSVLATAWALFSGPTRYISLAVAAFFGVGAYTTVVLGGAIPWPLVLCVAAALAFVLAAVVGLFTLRLSGVYFVIFTLGLTELVRQLVTWYEVKISNVLGRYVFLEMSQEQIYYQLLALLAATFLIGWIIRRSRLGFAIRAIGDDETVASHFGVNTALIKVVLFAISAAIMGLAGAIVAPRWFYLDPSIAFNPISSFQIVIMSLLGGAGWLWGPILGVVPLTIVFDTISTSFPNYATLLIGLIFMLVVYFLPKGVAGLVLAIRNRFTGHGAGRS